MKKGTITETGAGERLAPSFEDFFRSEYGRLASTLQLLTGDAGEAEDDAQEALSRVFERWDRVRNMDSSTGYVYRTALNLYRKRLRRREKGAPADPATGSDPTLIAETRIAIRQALVALSTEQREALVLVEWVGLDASEAGAVLGISPESVRARIHRARSALRSWFGGIDE